MQTLEYKISHDAQIQGGYCTVWSLFIMEMILINPHLSTNEIIKRVLYKYKQSNNIYYISDIGKGYIRYISEKLSKYYSIIFEKEITTDYIIDILYYNKEKEEKDLIDIFNIILFIEEHLLNNPDINIDKFKNEVRIENKDKIPDDVIEKIIKTIDYKRQLKYSSSMTNNSKSSSNKYHQTLKKSNEKRKKTMKTKALYRCVLTGRHNGVLTKYKLTRMAFKSLAGSGLLPGIHKSSW